MICEYPVFFSVTPSCFFLVLVGGGSVFARACSRDAGAKMGLDHRVGHPVPCTLPHGSPRRAEGGRRYLDRVQYRGKPRVRLLPEKPLHRCGSIRAREHNVVNRRQVCTLPMRLSENYRKRFFELRLCLRGHPPTREPVPLQVERDT